MTTNEQARADHECSACGGHGKAHDPAYVRVYDCAACPVCLGSGRISDRMPVADAMADAETLRNIANTYPHYSRHLDETLDVQAAGPRDGSWAYLTPYDARNAAHAAFRAVPGLRG